jgi:hypothetical protein
VYGPPPNVRFAPLVDAPVGQHAIPPPPAGPPAGAPPPAGPPAGEFHPWGLLGEEAALDEEDASGEGVKEEKEEVGDEEKSEGEDGLVVDKLMDCFEEGDEQADDGLECPDHAEGNGGQGPPPKKKAKLSCDLMASYKKLSSNVLSTTRTHGSLLFERISKWLQACQQLPGASSCGC